MSFYRRNEVKIQKLLFGCVIVLAIFIRSWAAPLSATEDMAQFWSFAKLFHLHGVDFYRYANGAQPINPLQGWAYVYPPIWILLLGLALFVSPGSLATPSMVDTSWRAAMKTPIILADIAIGVMLYSLVPGKRWKKLLFASLWLFNPTAWYESAVFGQFDALAVAFMIASFLLFERHRYRLGFIFAALAVLTKQHTLIPLMLMVLANAQALGKKELFKGLIASTSAVILVSLPFLATGNIYEYFRLVLFPGPQPGYDPLVYAFSGSGALLTYLHDAFDWSTKGWLYINVIILVIAYIIISLLSYKRRFSPLQGMLLGTLLFISIYYRVHYQYLLLMIPVALLVSSRTIYTGERIMTLILAWIPAVWMWIYPITFWFEFAEPKHEWASRVLSHFGLSSQVFPDLVYVLLALVLMLCCFTYIALVFSRNWGKENKTRAQEKPLINTSLSLTT